MPDKFPPLHKQKKLFIFSRMRYVSPLPLLYTLHALPLLAGSLRHAR